MRFDQYWKPGMLIGGETEIPPIRQVKALPPPGSTVIVTDAAPTANPLSVPMFPQGNPFYIDPKDNTVKKTPVPDIPPAQDFTLIGDAYEGDVTDKDDSFASVVDMINQETSTETLARRKAQVSASLEYLEDKLKTHPVRNAVCPRCTKGKKFKKCCETEEEKALVMEFRKLRKEAMETGLIAASTENEPLPRKPINITDAVLVEGPDSDDDPIPLTTPKTPIGFGIPSTPPPTIPPLPTSPKPRPLPTKRYDSKWFLEDVEKSKLVTEPQLAVYRILFQKGPLTGTELNELMKLGDEVNPGYHKLLPVLERRGIIDRVGEKECTVTKQVVTAWDVNGEKPLAKPMKSCTPKVREILAIGVCPIDTINLMVSGLGWEISEIGKIPPRYPREGQASWSTTVTMTTGEVWQSSGIYAPGGAILCEWKAVTP